jgi:DNA primase large subunit
MDEDSRLLPVLEHLSISFLAGISGSDFVTTSNPDGSELTAGMIDALAKQHFPPCMKNLWILLRKDKHLKYGGRQQLNLFLKVCLDRIFFFFFQGKGIALTRSFA